ncbi:Hypothetical predicted protein [Pelobates cultripes]|uniref:Uncharacterized protein n=1 Tax=Pelobates cultripes TaxID=61616 RepID=A0AAD1SJG2_PELCU|nr:Hypothetical predicted protein [Pelobates cultripes]
MADYAEAHDSFAAKMEEMEEWLEKQELKNMDLEERSQCQNLRVRGVPEDVQATDLMAYLTGMFQALAPDIPANMFLMDRAHRVAKPQYLPASTTRDVLTKLHYYHVKEALLRSTWPQHDLPEQYRHIQVYADLSAETLRHRRHFRDITSELRNRKIPYRWGFPIKLLIS